MIEYPKFYIGAMSKNVVDSVIEFSKDTGVAVGFISSRRQVDHEGGYVNNWTTKTFSEYNNRRILIERDHGGPDQGANKDNGFISYENDSRFFDIIHIDPWKKYQDYKKGLSETVESIKKIHSWNSSIAFEVGTEEAIRKFSVLELERFLEDLSDQLHPDIFEKIVYAVVQSGVGLNLGKMKNTGNFDLNRLKSMIDICEKFDKKSKEHNGDYLSNSDYSIRFDAGLDSINIAPEFGQIETIVYMNHMDDKSIGKWYDLCLQSRKWEKWVGDSFDISDKKTLIKICGHYLLASEKFKCIKPQVDDIVTSVIKDKLGRLYEL